MTQPPLTPPPAIPPPGSGVAPRRLPDVGPMTTIPSFYRVLLRGQLTKGRMVGLAALGFVALLLAFVGRNSTESDAVDILAGYGISLMIPLAALLLATPMIGNLVEDRLLVYLWLKPVPRWHLAVAAVAAVVTVLVPVLLLPLALSALLMGLPSMIVPVIASTLLGSFAYGAAFVFVGSRFSIGLWLGLLYVVLWEQTLSRLTDGMGRLSIRSYLASNLARGTDVRVDLADRSTVAAIVVPIVVGVVATLLTAWTLRTRDID